MQQLDVQLFGRFEVRVDSRPVPDDAWPQKRAADLVKLLALARGHRMPRDQVLEMLWPRLGADAAAANLHKAASYARRALGERDAVVVRGGVVALAPDADVSTDVERFESGDDTAYVGDLLPDDPYEEWTLGPRARLRERRLEVMRSQGRWEEVLREDPADEQAHRALMRGFAESGDRPGAARQFRRLQEELSRIGAEPSAETLALERELMRGPTIHAPRFLPGLLEGRERELATALGALQRAANGDGGALLVTGPIGIGKTRMIEAVLAEAERLGFHTLRGAAHEGEGRTPYTPIVEALDPLAARRPELIGALADGSNRALAVAAVGAAPNGAYPGARRPPTGLPRGRGGCGRGRRGVWTCARDRRPGQRRRGDRVARAPPRTERGRRASARGRRNVRRAAPRGGGPRPFEAGRSWRHR
jgi:DNA-binding SARP family transcriptional activator